jgi:hypothetical protein
MKRIVLLALSLVVAWPARAQWHETGGSSKVIGGRRCAAPSMCPTGSNRDRFASYYAPTYAYGEPGCNLPDRNGTNISGRCMFLYVQGDHDITDVARDENTKLCSCVRSPCLTDQVLMYWNPDTWNGQNSRYDDVAGNLAARRGGTQLLPGVDYLGNAMPGLCTHYAGPSVFQHDGEYFMTASESPYGEVFDKQWWGVSPDGKTWTWYPLFNYVGTNENIFLPGVTLQPVSIGGTLYFFGFVEIHDGVVGAGIGAIRLRANLQRARRYDRVEIYSATPASNCGEPASNWVPIVCDPLTNPAGDFSNALPTRLLYGVSPKYVSVQELWFTGSGYRDCSMACPGNDFTLTSGVYGHYDRIGYANVMAPGTTTGAPTVIDRDWLRSDSVNRCMPAKVDAGRIGPAPLPGGSPRVLYSTSNDDEWGTPKDWPTLPDEEQETSCTEAPADYAQWRDMYVVATRMSRDLRLYTVAPCRVFDSRLTAPLASGVPRVVPMAGASCYIPSNAVAVVLNATVVSPSGSATVALYPDPSHPTATVVVAAAANQTRGGSAVIGMVNGSLVATATVGGGGTTNLIVDVTGYFY